MATVPWKTAIAAGLGLALSACGGGSSSKSTPPPVTPTDHLVTISWTANREAGVNKAGGGYTVAIAGMAAIDVPYVTGAAAPTSTGVTLRTGTYTATVTAYAALDALGGATGSRSAPSQVLTIVVP